MDLRRARGRHSSRSRPDVIGSKILGVGSPGSVSVRAATGFITRAVRGKVSHDCSQVPKRGRGRTAPAASRPRATTKRRVGLMFGRKKKLYAEGAQTEGQVVALTSYTGGIGSSS
jgi:hypothetical protein